MAGATQPLPGFDDDDAFADAPKPPQQPVTAHRKRTKKADASSSSRTPKPTTSHVQAVGQPGPVSSVQSPNTAQPLSAAPSGSKADTLPLLATPVKPGQTCSECPPSGPGAPLAPQSGNTQQGGSDKKPAVKRKAAVPADGESPAAPKGQTLAARSSKAASMPSTPKWRTPAEVPDLVESFVLRKNKPVSAQIISDGLLGDQHKVSKAAVEKALVVLVERGTVSVGEWGKSKLFWANQAMLSTTDDEGIDGKIAAIQARISELRSAGNARAKDVAERRNLPTYTQLGEMLVKEEEACDALAKRLSEREANSKGGKAFTASEMKKIRNQYDKLQKEWLRRKRMLKDKLQEYAEHSGKKIPSLVEDLGIELDEDVGVDATQYGVRCVWK